VKRNKQRENKEINKREEKEIIGGWENKKAFILEKHGLGGAFVRRCSSKAQRYASFPYRQTWQVCVHQITTTRGYVSTTIVMCFYSSFLSANLL
jgi:hypothetical protein